MIISGLDNNIKLQEKRYKSSKTSQNNFNYKELNQNNLQNQDDQFITESEPLTYKPKLSIQSSLQISFYDSKYSNNFFLLNIISMFMCIIVTIMILQLGLKHLTGVNDGVIEFVSDTTVYRLHPNIKLENQQYDVWPSAINNQDSINVIYNVNMDQTQNEDGHIDYQNITNNNDVEDNLYQISKNDPTQIQKHVLNDIKYEYNIHNNTKVSQSVQQLSLMKQIMLQTAITLAIYLATLKIFELLDESMEQIQISVSIPDGWFVFLIGLWCYTLALVINWTSVQFICSNVDIVNCIVRTAGMMFISTFDELAQKVLLLMSNGSSDIVEQEKMEVMAYSLKYDVYQMFLTSISRLTMLYYCITPFQQFICRLTKFQWKKDQLPNIIVTRI